MTPSPAATSPAAVQDPTAAIEHLAQLTTLVLNEHVNDNGLCAVCPGVAFPCMSAVLAEHNAALL